MSIMELGALGEFVGSFLVLLTLVYLSIQVRQNNKMTRTNMRMAVSAAQVEALKILVEPRVAEVVSPLSVAESGFPEPGTPESSVVYAYVNVNLVAFVRYVVGGDPVGQVLVIFVITIAAAEVGLALAIILRLYRNWNSVNLDRISTLQQ